MSGVRTPESQSCCDDRQTIPAYDARKQQDDNMNFCLSRTPSLRLVISRCCHTELSDPQVQRIRWLKRIFAYGLFGGTLVVGLLVKSRKREELSHLMEQTERIGTFGYLPMYRYKGYVLPEPVVKAMSAISNFEFRDEDVVLISFPKTGESFLCLA